LNKNMKTKTVIWVVVLTVILVAVVIFVATRGRATVQTTIGQPISAAYSCDAGETITATYYQGASKPATSAGGPPVPGGSVALTLSDGRVMTLPQTISADGGRYANADESVVFWNVGNEATLTENNQQTFSGCVSVVNDPGGLPQAYASSTAGFSIRYPAGFTVDENYSYQELGPGKDISGVKFTIPASEAAGTNLGSDSYLSVEKISQAQGQTCDPSIFLGQQGPLPMDIQVVNDNGTAYLMASTTGAGAGNRYEETVYVLQGTNPCVAVRYFVHYGVLDNYPAGTIQQFDEAALLSQFDLIRQTLTLAH
jgi:membrane-bound inhibitor of C-type lysozyme